MRVGDAERKGTEKEAEGGTQTSLDTCVDRWKKEEGGGRGSRIEIEKRSRDRA